MKPRSCSPHRRPRAEAYFRTRRVAIRLSGFAGSLCYPLERRGVRVVDGAALEKRCAKAPWVRIPPSPPSTLTHGSGRPFVGPSAPSLTHTTVRSLGCSVPPWSDLAHGLADAPTQPRGEVA